MSRFAGIWGYAYRTYSSYGTHGTYLWGLAKAAWSFE